MAPRYDVTDHPLLSEDAAALTTEQLAEQNLLAEDLLGFTDAALLTDPDTVARATRLIVLQVNYQVETGIDASIYASQRRGQREIGYKPNLGLILPGLLDEVEALLEDEGAGGGSSFGVITSLR